MTLFAFFWAALLPHHPAIVHLPKSSTLLAPSPYAAAFLGSQAQPNLRQKNAVASHPSSPLLLQAPVYEPLPLEPQLFWPEEAAVDWHRWSAAAAVAIVVHPRSAAHMASDVAHLSPAAGPCVSYPSPALDKAEADGFTIQVNNMAIGQVASRQTAVAVADQLREAVPLLEANPDGLTPSLSSTEAAGQVDGQTVFRLPEPDPSASADSKQAALQATQWVNNLRRAFGAESLDSSQVQMVAHGLGETNQTIGGTASWYGPYFHGRQTATGETFNQHELTAAHKTLPFGTHLKVRNQLNGKTVVVRINDRGPYIGDRSLDLSYAAAQCLGAEHVGLIPYQATILAPGFPYAWRQDVVAALP